MRPPAEYIVVVRLNVVQDSAIQHGGSPDRKASVRGQERHARLSLSIKGAGVFDLEPHQSTPATIDATGGYVLF